MSRSKITSASIEDSTIAAKDIASGAVEDAMVTPSGRRNLIINGAMQVAQRGTSFTQANPGTSSFYYLDRFKMQSDLPPITYVVDKSSDVPAGSGFSNCFKVTVTSPASSFPDASGRYFRIRQSLEAQDVRHLVNKTVTLSFWVKSSVVGQFDVTFFAQDSSSNHYVVPYNIDSANTWEKKEITFTGPATINNDTGMGLDIQWQLARAGTNYQTTSTEVWGPTRLSSTTSTADVATTANATFQLTGVQLEVGSVATPFEHRSYGEELARCQRYYYQKGGGGGKLIGTASTVSSSELAVYVPLPTSMRTIPSVSYDGLSDYEFRRGDNTQVTLSASSLGTGSSTPEQMLMWFAGVGSIGQNQMGFLRVRSGTGTHYFYFDAEL